jgi:hypothetical protein
LNPSYDYKRREQTMNNADKLYLQSVAKIRDSKFVPEQLSYMGQYYRDTAEAYRAKSINLNPEYAKWQGIWDNRFKRAEDAYLAQWKTSILDSFKGKNIDLLRLQRDPSVAMYDKAMEAKTAADLADYRQFKPMNVEVSAYDKNSPYFNNKTVQYSKLFDENGNRRSFEDIIKADTSQRGNKFLLAQEGDQLLGSKAAYDNSVTTAEAYQSQYNQAMADLLTRNEEAKKKFLADKQAALDAASSTAYHGATYIERPL